MNMSLDSFHFQKGNNLNAPFPLTWLLVWKSLYLIVKTKEVKNYAAKLYCNVHFIAGKTFHTAETESKHLQAHNQQDMTLSDH